MACANVRGDQNSIILKLCVRFTLPSRRTCADTFRCLYPHMGLQEARSEAQYGAIGECYSAPGAQDAVGCRQSSSSNLSQRPQPYTSRVTDGQERRE